MNDVPFASRPSSPLTLWSSASAKADSTLGWMIVALGPGRPPGSVSGG